MAVIHAPRHARKASDARLCPEQPRLTSRDLDFGPVAELHMQLSADAGLDALDVIEIDDLPAVRTKEASRIEALLEACQGACEQRTGFAPVEPHVVALGHHQANLAQGHEPAARAVTDEQSLDGRAEPRSRWSVRFRGLRSRYGRGQALRLDRLQQVVERV